jgi:hypothetical protein
VAFTANDTVYGSIDSLAIIGSTMAMLENCYFGEMDNTAISTVSGVFGSYSAAVTCDIGNLIENNGNLTDLGGHIVNTTCTSQSVLDDIVHGLIVDDDGDWLPDGTSLDIDGDGVVGGNDLVLLLQQYGSSSPEYADFNGDGVVDVIDLIRLLKAWG